VQPLHDCWLARFNASVPCDGPMDKAHLLPKQRIKRQFAGSDPETLRAVIWHRSLWVPACRRHHGDFDNYVFRITREDLPEGLEYAAHVLGLGWSLDADYGSLEDAA
jgi:hypothetical protein